VKFLFEFPYYVYVFSFELELNSLCSFLISVPYGKEAALYFRYD